MSTPTGWQYSAVLIDRARSDLAETYGGPIDDQTVARHLGVETAQIKAVMDSRATLGSAVFRRLAEEYGKDLVAFMADLALWNREKNAES